MKKLLLILLLINTYTFAQVGVGNIDPKSTLDVSAINPTGTTTNVDGITFPTVTRQRAQSMTAAHIPTSTIIYISEAITGTATGTTLNVSSAGFYFWDGTLWNAIKTNKNVTTTINQSLPSVELYLGDGYNLGTGGWSYSGWTTGTALSRNVISNGGSGSFYSPTATTITNLSLNGWLLISSGNYNVNVTIYIMKYSLGTTSTLSTNTVTGTPLGSQNIVLNTANTIYPVNINVLSTNLLAGDVILCWIVRNNGNANPRTFEFGGQLQFNQ